jgi:hypothetical protein
MSKRAKQQLLKLLREKLQEPKKKTASLEVKKQLLEKLKTQRVQQLNPQWERFLEILEFLNFDTEYYLKYLGIDLPTFIGWQSGEGIDKRSFWEALIKLEVAYRRELIFRRKEEMPTTEDPKHTARDFMGGPSDRPGWRRTGGGWHRSGYSGWRYF